MGLEAPFLKGGGEENKLYQDNYCRGEVTANISTGFASSSIRVRVYSTLMICS